MNCSSCGAALAADARFCSSCGSAIARHAPSQADPLRDLLQSALAPGIEIVRPIGRGGMGAVYLGRETALDREVAIKTLAPEVAGAPELRERFRREARIAAKLTHPNIVPLHTFGESRDVIYFVMGFVRGESLAERLGRATTIGPDEARRILVELADALAYAHERGIVHRDIKPENVLIEDATGKAILTDFGIARMSGGTSLTQAGGFLGTPQYMSPEQARGAEVGPPSDIYSLGVLAYRMLTGTPPVRADSIPDLVAKLAGREAPAIETLPEEVPPALADAVMRCLRNEPAERMTAAAVRDAVRTDAGAPAIPDEMTAFEGRLFVTFPIGVIALMLVPLELFLWNYVEPSWRMIIQLFQLGAVMLVGFLGVGFSEGRRLGLRARTVAAIIVRQPRWFAGWVPRWARRPGDFFSRLPLALRLPRIAASICYLGALPLIVIVPYALIGIQANVDLLSQVLHFSLAFMGVFLFLMGALIHANVVLARRGLTAEERSRIMSVPPLPGTAWEQPKYAALLLPAKAGANEKAPTSPELIGERVLIRARKLPSPTAARVVELERALADGILGMDAEARRLDALLDPDDVEHVARRLAAVVESDAVEGSEVRRLLVEQQRVFRDLVTKREGLAQRRESWMIRLRKLDAAIAGDAAELERQSTAIREFLASDGRTAIEGPTALQP